MSRIAFERWHGHRCGPRLLIAVALFLGLAIPAPVHGQNNEPLPAGSAPQPITREMIESRLKELDENRELSDEAKTRVRELYQQALQDLDVGVNLAAQATAFADMASNFSSRFEEVKTRLDRLGTQPEVEIPEDATLADLEQLLKQEEADLAKLKQELARLDAEQLRRQSRRTEIPAAVATIQDRLTAIDKQLAIPPPDDEPTLLGEARRTRLRSQRQMLEQELATGQKELAAYATETAEFLNAQRDLVARLASQAESRVSRIRELANLSRQQEAERLAADARREVAAAHPVLQPEAQRNAYLAEEAEKLAPMIREASDELEASNRALEQIKSDFQTIQDKVDRGGLTEGIGLLLRRHLANLPDERQFRRALQLRRGELRQAELSLIELTDERYTLGDTQATANRLLAELATSYPATEQADLKRALVELLETRKRLLDKLIQSQSNRFDLLVQLDSTERELLRELRAYSEYLQELVLWIRSAPIFLGDIRPAGQVLSWLFSPANWIDVAWAIVPYGQTIQSLRQERKTPSWTEVGATVGHRLTQRPHVLIGTLIFVVYFLVLTLNQRRLRRQIRDLGEKASRRNCQHFLPTFHAFLDTVLLSLLWPSLFLFTAWRLSAAIDPTDFVRAVGSGLGATGVIYLSFEFLRQLCRPNGLAESHFDWPSEAHTTLRRAARNVIMSFLPAAFLFYLFDHQSSESWQNSFGRICFLVGMTVLAVIAHRTLGGASVLHQGFQRTDSDGLFFRFRRLWHVAAVGSLLALIALAVAGYYYTAFKLAFRLHETLWLMLSLLLVASLVLRWLMVNRRRLAIEQALQRRRAAQAMDTESEQARILATTTLISDSEIDLGAMSQQSQQLLRVSLFVIGLLGLWWIWRDVLPALGVLERVRIYRVTMLGELQWITLQHLVVSLTILGLTVLAVRNLPSLLELLLLQRLPLDSGTRYAITTCLRYLITVLGVIFAFRTLGIEWSQYQWLVAAASVGLGFGLQEIFANFVSGLIVLMERPVRVGDVVTVEGVTGIVSRIRMRATTVTNWDRQEFIVPNKDFVTGRLLNWTLSNAVTRVVVNVGVAYGSDAGQATQLLEKIAAENANILDDPPPLATFEGFGDSTLNLVLRCFLPNLDSRLRTVHQLHTQINQRFAEAGIEIAFPQRDIHIRSLDKAIVVEPRRPA